MSTDVAPAPRSDLRAVAVPAEHGGWGLTLEPALLGLLVAPGAAGWCLAAAAVLGFVSRTPVKTLLVDLRRGRALRRTRVAAAVAGVELVALGALGIAAVALADGAFWWPLLLVAPLVGLELWFDMRSRSRRLVPELAGAVGISGVAAMIVLADGAPTALAAGVWLIPAARAVTSIPAVRAVIAGLHHRAVDTTTLLRADLAATGLAATAVMAQRSLLAGAVAVGGVVVVQRITAHRPPHRVAVLGARQMLLGFAVVLVTAAGVHWAWGTGGMT